MKVTVIVNRAARNGCDRRRLDAIQHELSAWNPRIVVPASYEELCQAALACTHDGTDLIVVVGGDGTVNAVLNQIAGSAVAMGIVPAGTANDLATHLGVPRHPRKACRVIRQGRTRAIDLIRINDRLFATAGGMGVVSDVAVGVNRLKAKDGWVRKTTKILGSLVYVLYSFVLLLFSRRILSDLTVTLDGHDMGTMRSVALFVHNQPTIGKTVHSFPGAKVDDGKLGLCVMRERNRLQSILTVILMSLQGRHTRRQEIVLREGQDLTVTCPDPKVFIGDGEVLAETRLLAMKVEPLALRVVVGSGLADDAYLEVRVEKGAVAPEKLGAPVG